MATQTSSVLTTTTGHVGIGVTDLTRSKDFYQSVFGYDVVMEGSEPDRRFAFLGAEGKLLLTLWQQATSAYDGRTSGLHHLSFQVNSIADVQEAERRVRAAGSKPYHDGIVAHREGASSGGIFFEDPDGTRLEIYAPTGAEQHEAPSSAAPTCGFF
jgi:catechol 2,3-dioxygenase-like lactoylglutathione lyase family enzyme